MVKEYNEKYLEEKFTHINELFDEKLKGLLSGLSEIKTILNKQVELMNVSQKDVTALREKHDRDLKDMVKMVNAMGVTWHQNLNETTNKLNEDIADLKVERENKTNEIKLKLKYTQFAGVAGVIVILFVVVEESREFIINSILGFLGLPHS